MNAIPVALKRAIGVGIGLFILFIGLVVGGHRRSRRRRACRSTLGDLTGRAGGGGPRSGSCSPLWLMPRGVRAARSWSASSRPPSLAIAVNCGHRRPRVPDPGRRRCARPRSSACPTSRPSAPVSTSSVFAPARRPHRRCWSIFSIMLSDFFDTMGTVIGIGGEAGWLDARRATCRGSTGSLLVDSLAAVAGGAARRLVGHHLHRVGGGRGGGGAHRARLGGDRRLLPARAVLRAARRGGAGPGHRAGPDHGRLPDEPRGPRHPLRTTSRRACRRSSPWR